MKKPLDNKANLTPYSTIDSNQRGGGIFAMLNKQSVWVKWKAKKQRYEVGFYWEKKRYRFYSWTFQGNRLQFKTKDIADEFANQIKAEMRPNRKGIITFDPAKYTGQKKTVYAISEHSKLWLKEYEIQIQTEDVSKEYYKHLERYFRLHINPAIGDIDIRELNEPTIKRLYLSLFEKGLGKKMVQNVMDTLKKFVHDSFEEKVIYEMIRFPKYKSKKGSAKKRKPKWLTEVEQDEVLRHIPNAHVPMAMCALYHGLRQAEVRNLSRKDVNTSRGTMTIDTLKGGMPREILLEPALLELIKKIPPTLTHNFLFHYQHGKIRRPYKKNFQWHIFRQALDKAGFTNFSPNEACRHSHASQLLRRGASTRHAQKILGHTDIRTTEIYAHVLTEDQAKFRRAEKFDGGQVVAI